VGRTTFISAQARSKGNDRCRGQCQRGSVLGPRVVAELLAHIRPSEILLENAIEWIDARMVVCHYMRVENG
jgi:hypothetical protein